MSRASALALLFGARLLMGLLFVSMIFHLPQAGAWFPKVPESSKALTLTQARKKRKTIMKKHTRLRKEISIGVKRRERKEQNMR